jgi:hypothetical protein
LTKRSDLVEIKGKGSMPTF